MLDDYTKGEVMPKSRHEERESVHGQKMIEVKVRFWTNDIAEGEKKIVPKHAWTAGVVRVKSNAAHGIKQTKTFPFHSVMDISAAIEACLVHEGISLHPSRRMKKYFDEE